MRSGITLQNKVVRQQLSMKTVTFKMIDCMQIKTKQDFKGSQEGMQTLQSIRLHENLNTDPRKGRERSEPGTLAACVLPAPRTAEDERTAQNHCALVGESLPGGPVTNKQGLEPGWSRRYQYELTYVNMYAATEIQTCVHTWLGRRTFLSKLRPHRA